MEAALPHTRLGVWAHALQPPRELQSKPQAPWPALFLDVSAFLAQEASVWRSFYWGPSVETFSGATAETSSWWEEKPLHSDSVLSHISSFPSSPLPRLHKMAGIFGQDSLIVRQFPTYVLIHLTLTGVIPQRKMKQKRGWCFLQLPLANTVIVRDYRFDCYFHLSLIVLISCSDTWCLSLAL